MAENDQQKNESQVLNVDETSAGQRVDVFTARQITDFSRSQIARLIKEGTLTVNGHQVKAKHRLRVGDVVELAELPPRVTTVEPENIPLEITYEDDDLLVINKPAGLVCHPGAGNRSGTLVNALMFHCRQLSSIGAPERAGIVHRLDKGTSGLLVAAKNDQAHRKLAGQLQDKSLFREYLAFTWGRLKESSGEWDLPIGRSISNPKCMRVDFGSGREAVTEYEVLQHFGICDKLCLRLRTGRTHQIRVHLSHHNHPVFGDPDYSGREEQVRGIDPPLRPSARQLLRIINRPALHATRLGFIHPADGRSLEFAADPPADMLKLEAALVEGLAG